MSSRVLKELGCLPFIKEADTLKLIETFLDVLFTTVDSDLAKGVGDLRFVLFIWKSFVKLGHNVFGNTWGFVFQTIKFVTVHIECFGGHFSLFGWYAELLGYVSNQDIELSVKQFVFLGKLGGLEVLCHSGQDSGNDAKRSEHYRENGCVKKGVACFTHHCEVC